MPRQERAWRLGGEGGEGAGKIGHRRAPFYPPSHGAAPRKKGAVGRGVEGGGNQFPIPNSPLAPTRPHPWHGQRALKVRASDGSGKGVGVGGTSTSSSPRQGQYLPAQGHVRAYSIFCLVLFWYIWGKCRPFSPKNFGANRFLVWALKTGRNSAPFFPRVSQADRLLLGALSRTKCCRFFSKSSLSQIDFWFGGLK